MLAPLVAAETVAALQIVGSVDAQQILEKYRSEDISRLPHRAALAVEQVLQAGAPP
ncbi:hypothetical protein O0880_12420 [Janthinobacterium sp. SUN118]|uniref:hypothetical protein n=1 Tax=Janthinobacterium sp. SUN118 TaxID=3004100 RepID=UPI0025B06D60|nr:hypothetical protein [Janthinobacterium sp. SUN118]MDN2710225.1 hypothetical protein [Janthinobacterium sp. SUN118]